MYLPQCKVPYPFLGLERGGVGSVWREWEEGREWEFGLVFLLKSNKNVHTISSLICDISYYSDFLEKAIAYIKPGYMV